MGGEGEGIILHVRFSPNNESCSATVVSIWKPQTCTDICKQSSLFYQHRHWIRTLHFEGNSTFCVLCSTFCQAFRWICGRPVYIYALRCRISRNGNVTITLATSLWRWLLWRWSLQRWSLQRKATRHKKALCVLNSALYSEQVRYIIIHNGFIKKSLLHFAKMSSNFPSHKFFRLQGH